MSSTIVVPSREVMGNSPNAIAEALVSELGHARTDINSLQGGATTTSVANAAALAALAAPTAATVALKTDDGSLWRFVAASAATDSLSQLVIAAGDASGAWVRLGGEIVLTLPVTKDTVDAATIYTVPTGARIHPKEAWWDVSVSWTGGSSSAIGVHASPTGWTTKGDILGGASGDVLATLVSTNTRMVGTIGTQLDTRAHGRLIMIAADTFKFDRITSAFTAGAANVRILCDVIANLGA